jgi:hypothetical protein
MDRQQLLLFVWLTNLYLINFKLLIFLLSTNCVIHLEACIEEQNVYLIDVCVHLVWRQGQARD